MTTLATRVTIEAAMTIMDRHDVKHHRGWPSACWDVQGYDSDKGESIYDVYCPVCDPSAQDGGADREQETDDV